MLSCFGISEQEIESALSDTKTTFCTSTAVADKPATLEQCVKALKIAVGTLAKIKKDGKRALNKDQNINLRKEIVDAYMELTQLQSYSGPDKAQMCFEFARKWSGIVYIPEPIQPQPQTQLLVHGSRGSVDSASTSSGGTHHIPDQFYQAEIVSGYGEIDIHDEENSFGSTPGPKKVDLDVFLMDGLNDDPSDGSLSHLTNPGGQHVKHTGCFADAAPRMAHSTKEIEMSQFKQPGDDEPFEGKEDHPVSQPENHEPVEDEEDQPVDQPEDAEPIEGKEEDQPVDQPENDEPSENKEDHPVSQPEGDEPVVDKGDQPMDQSENEEDQPVDQPEDDEPIEGKEDQPVDQPEDDEPFENKEDQPVSQPEDDEPVVGKGDQPVDQSEDEEDQPADQPEDDEPIEGKEDQPVDQPEGEPDDTAKIQSSLRKELEELEKQKSDIEKELSLDELEFWKDEKRKKLRELEEQKREIETRLALVELDSWKEMEKRKMEDLEDLEEPEEPAEARILEKMRMPRWRELDELDEPDELDWEILKLGTEERKRRISRLPPFVR
ncbi:hypothetical protein BGX34_001591 [Mortierella sp. NVP85]|nr:hypothetical protein BGX34_001591 [Mortierella sp. NVP85]